MNVIYENKSGKIVHGDNLDVLKENFKDNDGDVQVHGIHRKGAAIDCTGLDSFNENICNIPQRKCRKSINDSLC